jgi:transcriptional regulator with XRE-family HTH domain
MTTRIQLGRAIRAARIERGWTQAQLGERMYRSRSHAAISDIETGKTGLDIQEISEVAELLGVSLLRLVSPNDADTDVLTRLDRVERRVEQWFARIREKVEYLYGGYVSGEAIRVTLDEGLVVDAVWEARLFELDAMLTAAREEGVTEPDPATINEEAKFRDRERLKASGVVPIVMPKEE